MPVGAVGICGYGGHAPASGHVISACSPGTARGSVTLHCACATCNASPVPAAQCQVNKTDMPIKPIASRTHVKPHLKRVGLCAGALAVVYAAVQEHDHVVGQIANVQHMLTQNGLTLMQKLWEVADASLAKVHETFIAAAPPTNLEAAVRHGLIGRPEDTVPRGRAKASAIRVRESDANADDEDGDDPPLEEKTGHRTRRARHSGPEQNAAPSQHRCSSRAAL